MTPKESKNIMVFKSLLGMGTKQFLKVVLSLLLFWV